MAQQNLQKAEALMEAGRKEKNKSGFATLFSSKETKFENASESFEKAASAYKLAKAWGEAGGAYREAADCHKQLGSSTEAAGKLKEAGECYKKSPSHTLECVDVWREACELFVDAGRWNQCGNLTKAIAEMYEAAHENGLATTCENPLREAIDAYQQASDYYMNESPPREQAANTCQEKVAQLSADPTVEGGFSRAAGIFEEIAKSCLGNKLLKFNARAHMVKALVCHTAAGDNVTTAQKLTEFQRLDYSLEGSREEKFITAIMEAISKNDADAFGAASAEYNAIKKIDPWMTTVLLHCKRSIVVEEPEAEDEAEEEEAEDGASGAAAAEEEEDLT